VNASTFFSKLNKAFWVLIVVSSPYIFFSQTLVNYSSVRNTGLTYTSISGSGTTFSSWRNTGANSQDDNRSVFTPIGFDFWYLGVRYTQFSASTNGFIDFSSSTDDGGPQADDFGFSNVAFTTANINNSTRPAIAPFYDDLTTQGGVDPIGTSIKYLVSGTAPNRTLTVEWINMAVFGNVSPSLNFQVQLLETSGIIRINYGVMNAGNHTFSFSMGLNGVTISNTPTAAQLKMLQTVNGNTFNNTVQNNLSLMPAANSQYVFTPVLPTPVSGNLTFSGVSQTGMTLNWSNWAGNEMGYVIYNSTDGINYSFVTQTAINAINSAITGLNPSTTYFWRVFAVTEGALSTALTGTQATLGAGNKISLTSGNWNTANTWTPNGVPTAGDNVTIANGHLVLINTNAVCNALTVGAGTGSTLQFSGAARTMTVNNNLLVNPNAVFQVDPNSNTTHQLTVEGNIANNGTLSFSVDVNSLCNLTLSSFTTQVLSGNGANRFNFIIQNTGSSRNNFFDISCRTFSAPVNFLTLNSGTFRLSTTDPVNITPFAAATTISNICGLWVNAGNAIVSTGAGLTLSGGITVSNGTLNIGNAADEDLFSDGGEVNLSNGALNISGKYYSTGINNISNFSISGGTLTVPTSGSSSTADAPFQVTGVGSEFDMTGGLVVIQREGGSGAQDLGFINTGASSGIVSGGTLQIGNALTPTGQTININSIAPIGNLVINSPNANAALNANSLQVINNVLLSSGSLNDNGLTLGIGGNWTNNGGTYVNNSGTVIFNASASPQSIFKSGGESFNNLQFTGLGLKTFSSAVTAKGFTISNGASVDVSPSNHQLNLSGSFFNSGSFNSRNGTVLFNGTTLQTIGGSSTSDFYNLSQNNPVGSSLSTSVNLLNVLSISNGTFNTNGQNFTMVSTASNTARVAQITGSGDILGNVTVQRFALGGTTGWAFLGTPISSALTLQDWDDDIFISCSNCPDGSAGGFLSIYTYNEAATGLVDAPAAYVPLSGITDPITFGKGYWVYLGNGQFTTTDITLDVSGTLRKFNQTIPLTYNNYGSPADDGWNLIHNPYPSPISWTALRGATANLDNAVYVYNADLNAGLGGYATFVNGISLPAIGSGGIGNEIPMGQGFFVHSTGATALNATEAIKVNSNPVFLKTTAQSNPNLNPAPQLRLKLKDQASRDECVIYIENNASNGFDKTYDAYKLTGTDPSAPSIALLKDTVLFAINGVPSVNGTFSTDLKVTSGTSGHYSISASDFVGFPQGACLRLFDKYTNSTHDLRSGDYSFWHDDTTNAARFTVNIELQTLSVNVAVTAPSCQQVNGGLLIAQGNSAGPWHYIWKNANNQVLQNHSNQAGADSLKNLPGGLYILEMSTIGACDAYAGTFTLPVVQVPQANFVCVDSVNLDSNPQIQFSNTSINSSTYFWKFGDGNNSNQQSPFHVYTLPGVYRVELICESETQCIDSTSKQILVYSKYTNKPELEKNTGIVIYALGDKAFNIALPEQISGELVFELSDGLGKPIWRQTHTHHENSVYPLQLNTVADGVYYLKITSRSFSQTQKLVVF
jgi:hypothetical protein